MSRSTTVALIAVAGLLASLVLVSARPRGRDRNLSRFDSLITQNALALIEQGRQIFRYDTFGDEVFWGDTLQLHRAIAGEALGGVGDGLTPQMALDLGLKVDLDALPKRVRRQLKAGTIDLDAPASTLALLQVNAVVGVTGFFNEDGSLRSVGIQCAICHSTVDDALGAGIGRRLDGWANRDLDIGKIAALPPNLQPVADLLKVDVPTVKAVLESWGPGKFDAELLLDGQSIPTLIPPAFGLAGVNLHTWTGWGSVTYWNAFVANIEMHGQGTFYDPRLNDPARFPIAAAAGFGNIRSQQDLITAKLPALHFYQLSIPAPPPPEGSFDAAAAERGKGVFEGDEAKCATCHVPPLFTEPGWNLHLASEIGIDDVQASRSPDGRYRTSPLAGLWTHQKGGFYHDGRFATLRDVVDHYDNFFGPVLTEQEKNDLVEYLKSL